MMNSNKIRAAIAILRRVESFLNSGLKLKELKTELRVLPIELHDVAPVILVSAGRALHARSNADFAQRVKWAINDAVSALKVAEQMDAIHAEALEENDKFDGTIRDGLTDAQRAIHNSRMGIDIYGEGFRAAVERDHAEALVLNAGYDAHTAALCVDEGCPHHGTPHVCLPAPNPRQPSTFNKWGNCGRVFMTDDGQLVDFGNMGMRK